MNLLNHTLVVLQNNGKDPSDISYCQTAEGWFTWKEFVKLADIDYSRSLINKDLQIIGNDFIMYWTVIDGDQEWWFVDITPNKPDYYQKPTTLLA